MTEKPIIFSGPMVRAILNGRKTMTRRVLKTQPAWNPEPNPSFTWKKIGYPYVPGDVLWVREAWAKEGECDLQYKAGPHIGDDALGVTWKSPIFMPRWASRLTLRITGVRVERLRDISEDDAMAEGCVHHHDPDGDGQNVIEQFSHVWDNIHGPGSWEANPWVAAYRFERVMP